MVNGGFSEGKVSVHGQITQPTDNTGVAMYSCINVVLKDFNLFVAAGFGFYDGTPKGSNTLL